MNNIYHHNQLQERQNTSLVLTSSGTANPDVPSQEGSKLSGARRSGKTPDSGRTNVVKHTVFVLGINGKPLTPTTPQKARKLIKGGQARKIWSKFSTFGIQLTVETRKEIPITTLGYDPGTKFEGISVVVDKENNLSVKLDLPDKKRVVDKMYERRKMRQDRRKKLRCREERFNNRGSSGFIAPSQMMIVRSRLKIISEIIRIYPIQKVGMEDVKFNHLKHKWGSNFSTIEIGKNTIRKFFKNKNIEVIEFMGYETAEIRKKYGYKKTSSKSADKFNSHCSDSLSLACEAGKKEYIEPGLFLVIDDTYRCFRRKLYDMQFKSGGIREKVSRGSFNGLRKGIMIGVSRGIGQLCGSDRGKYRFYDTNGKRYSSTKIIWVSHQFKIISVKGEK